jgi:hypothetical protein
MTEKDHETETEQSKTEGRVQRGEFRKERQRSFLQFRERGLGHAGSTECDTTSGRQVARAAEDVKKRSFFALLCQFRKY